MLSNVARMPLNSGRVSGVSSQQAIQININQQSLVKLFRNTCIIICFKILTIVQLKLLSYQILLNSNINYALER